MYNLVGRGTLVLLLAAGLVLTGCIQPIDEVDQTKTAQATLGIVAAPPPTTAPVVNPTATTPPVIGGATPTAVPLPALVGQFVALRGDQGNNLQIWGDQYRGPDRLVGFSYTGLTATPCVGFVVLALVGGAWQLTDSGALFCAQPAAVDAFAAHTFILISEGPATVVFGRVTNNPGVTQVQIAFDDGNLLSTDVASGGFLLVKPGVASPVTITGTDAQGNVILPAIQYSPV